MQKRALAHAHEKDVRQRAFFMIDLWARWCTAYPTTMTSRHDAECFIPAPRCGYVFGLVPSVIVFVLPSFFLKEGSTFRK